MAPAGCLEGNCELNLEEATGEFAAACCLGPVAVDLVAEFLDADRHGEHTPIIFSDRLARRNLGWSVLRRGRAVVTTPSVQWLRESGQLTYLGEANPEVVVLCVRKSRPVTTNSGERRGANHGGAMAERVANEQLAPKIRVMAQCWFEPDMAPVGVDHLERRTDDGDGWVARHERGLASDAINVAVVVNIHACDESAACDAGSMSQGPHETSLRRGNDSKTWVLDRLEQRACVVLGMVVDHDQLEAHPRLTEYAAHRAQNIRCTVAHRHEDRHEDFFRNWQADLGAVGHITTERT
jgi:hypothetical protein